MSDRRVRLPTGVTPEGMLAMLEIAQREIVRAAIALRETIDAKGSPLAVVEEAEIGEASAVRALAQVYCLRTELEQIGRGEEGT